MLVTWLTIHNIGNKQYIKQYAITSRIMKFGLFRLSNRMVIFSKTEKIISQQTCKEPYIYDVHIEEGW